MKIATVKPGRRSSDSMEALWNDLFAPARPAHQRTAGPAFNILEWDDKFELQLAVPGFEKSDFSLKVEDDHLTIELNKEEVKDDESTVRRSGFKYGNFKKSFHISDDINQEGIDASYEQGILKVQLLKKEEAKKAEPKSINVL